MPHNGKIATILESAASPGEIRVILNGRKPEPEVLQEIIARVVQIAHPQRLVLFGSAARGEMGPDSDVDLLVVVQGPVHRRDLAGKIYRNLHGVPVPVDVVVVTENDVREFGDKIGTILYPALKEGVVVYEA